MSYLVVVLLSLLWLGFFLPGLLEARRSSPLATASTFQESLVRISTGRAVDADAAPAVRRRSRRQLARQRDVLAALAAVVASTVILALAFGGAARWLVVPSVLSLGAYVAVLRAQAVQIRDARRRLAAPGIASSPPGPAAAPVHAAGVSRVSPHQPADDLERIAG